ncbi:hypothetical protein BU23DRAFT_551882 [Bimuria novae-zelandiae CBS 107.79]|uniref:Uncharacterized protein n=1 Tax=Bimuria novae-zelandiae CBS 107.79 TaxID=1447943 RepID=A0A6A5VJ08_9PLEO|nr:hypothetical protein BU23DRAFT_551882 [Bimuria novae-zelandiae CBS 107.79]
MLWMSVALAVGVASLEMPPMSPYLSEVRGRIYGMNHCGEDTQCACNRGIEAGVKGYADKSQGKSYSSSLVAWVLSMCAAGTSIPSSMSSGFSWPSSRVTSSNTRSSTGAVASTTTQQNTLISTTSPAQTTSSETRRSSGNLITISETTMEPPSTTFSTLVPSSQEPIGTPSKTPPSTTSPSEHKATGLSEAAKLALGSVRPWPEFLS